MKKTKIIATLGPNSFDNSTKNKSFKYLNDNFLRIYINPTIK